ncbi:polyunsaturated fatty acid lipoxygenase ALOX15B-like [Mercenaria mercenaria]|uniref:polyunsaturated fatty acid lipoxygenase ALOX15B-like n=1 Tax=Mercenaria mercenaria TaxID=6596 RepID=UPI00234E6ADF|nr:polyunsaturated fatty acid lipoxygenase ALOX15B-like [Mercenaria mercenaria]
MRKLYELTEERLPGCPPLVKKFQPKYDDFTVEIESKITGTLMTSMAYVDKHYKTGGFYKLEDIKSVYEDGYFPAPSNLNRWRKDELFGMQRLMGVNPVLIRLCTKIPDKIAVNNQMLKPFLESMTLPQALQKKRIFMIDYEILDGLQTRPGYVITAPIVLFYQRDDGQLVPVAIQLQQKSGANNPVFLPSDPEHTWTLAKMWCNVADSNYHQSIAHLGFTHLKMEGVVVCTRRQIHRDHPIFKLLMSHFLYLLAINDVGIPLLLNEETGYVQRLSALGNKGMVELINRKNKTWRMDIDGTLPNDLKERGIDDSTLLPHYYYRNDANELYDAIFSYVKKYLDLYYTSDEDVKKDHELQKWRKEITAPVKDQGLGMLGVFGEKGKFTNKEQVCRTLTSIIFTCSVQHAAVNFRQYEDYGYPPNYPFSLRGSPPKSKDQIEENELLLSLPDKNTTLDILVITGVLSLNSTHALGNFDVEYMTDEKALRVVDEFRADLARIAKGNKQKNSEKRRLEKYWCLHPKFVPNSISS